MAVLGRALGIDAQSHTFARRLGRGAKFCQLRGRVEDDMVGVPQQLVHFICAVGRAENVHFFAGHSLRAEPRLKQAAGLGAARCGASSGYKS